VYRELGGHAGVRGQVIEDIAFGQRAKAAGRRVFTAATHDLFTARMYEGWGDTFRGLKKNAYAGANYHPLAVVPIAGFLLVLGAGAPVVMAAAVAWCAVHPTGLGLAAAGLGVVGAGAQLAAGMRAARLLGFSRWTAAALAPGFGFYLAIFLCSVVDYYRGGNTWAGRKMAAADVQSLAEAGAKAREQG
jgi:hypothetical protein